MPELPEVETVKETLKGLILNRRIEDIDIRYSNIVATDNEVFKKTLIGKTFSDIKRRGKLLIFEVDGDTSFYSHLRMEGKYFFVAKDMPIDKHTHVIFSLNEDVQLRYNDTRKFGRMGLLPFGNYKDIKNLGPEPFSDDLNVDYVRERLSRSRLPIKTLLLDQSFIAGIGNIYADEILFGVGVAPTIKAFNFPQDKIEKLIEVTRKVLADAIKQGGTTIRSYTSSLGVTGRFQNELAVHTKEVCPKCGARIEKIKVGGRGTYYCPICQK